MVNTSQSRQARVKKQSIELCQFALLVSGSRSLFITGS